MNIDTHCHLTDSRYEDVDAMINDFHKEDLKLAITVGYDLASSRGGVEISNKHKSVYSAIGVHPHDASTYNDDVEKEMIELSKNKKVVCYGEIGLDYYYDHSPRDVQKEVFIKQIILADKLSLPIAIHVRDAYADSYDILNEYKHLLKNSGILHCYSGSYEMLKKYLDLGLYVSYSGTVTFKNNQKADECIKGTPLDRILTETDSPYLTPMPFRGKTNYPTYVKYVAEKIADCYGMSVNALNEQVSKNVERLFKIKI